MRFVLAAVLTAASAQAGAAAPGAGDAATLASARNACANDALALCPGKEDGAELLCLAGDPGKIRSADCRTLILRFRTANDSVKKACADDIADKKCGGLELGAGLAKCLAKSLFWLSGDCRTALKTARRDMTQSSEKKP